MEKKSDEIEQLIQQGMFVESTTEHVKRKNEGLRGQERFVQNMKEAMERENRRKKKVNIFEFVVTFVMLGIGILALFLKKDGI